MAHLSRSSKVLLVQIAFALLLVLLLANVASAQTQAPKSRAGAAGEEEPTFHDYRGVQIGWLAEEVRKKLGDPANKSDEQDVFVFNEKEMAQIVYDKATRKVTTISVYFTNGASGVITPQQVFGADVEAKQDGSKYKLVRYPKVGYWVSYSRTSGDSPMVSITIQKMQ